MKFDLFYNHQKTGKEELESYLPSWYRQIREMNANNEFAGYTLDRMADELENLIENQFIQTCDEKTLEKFEHFLKIKNTSEYLDIRRKKVLAYWNGNRTINRTRIKELVMLYMNCDSNVWFDHKLHIMIEEDKEFLEEFIETLKDQIPSHVMWVIGYGNKINQKDAEIIKIYRLKTELTIDFMRHRRHLDGKKKLDGSAKLDGSSAVYIVAALKTIGSNVKKDMQADSGKMEARASIRTQENIGSRLLSETAIECEAEKKLELECTAKVTEPKESIGDISITTFNQNYRLLGGTKKLDGTAKLDSIYGKENVE